MQKEINALQLFESGLNKTEIKQIAESTILNIEEKGGALKVAESMSAMEALIKELKGNPRFTELTREEAANGVTTASGAKIECIEAGTKYNFSVCNDSVYDEFKIRKDTVDAAIKERETFLKTVPSKGLLIVDEETGEGYTVYPPAKSSTSTYKVTLAK